MYLKTLADTARKKLVEFGVSTAGTPEERLNKLVGSIRCAFSTQSMDITTSL